MNKVDKQEAGIPGNWRIETDKIAAYVWNVTAEALDGRKIEAIGSDEENLRRQVVDSIRDSDRQIRDLIEARKGLLRFRLRCFKDKLARSALTIFGSNSLRMKRCRLN